MEAEGSGSDLVILIYRTSPIRPDQLLLPIHQNLHANLEISREAQVAHKQAQGGHYDRKAKKVQVLQQFHSVRFQLDPKKPIRQKATDIFRQRLRTSHTNRPFASCHLLESKWHIGRRQTKKITILNDVCSLFLLSHCVYCSPAWRICTTWISNCKEPIYWFATTVTGAT